MSVVWIRGVLPMAMEEDARRGYCYVRRESTLKHMLYGGSFLTRPPTACSFPSTGAAWFGSPLRTPKGPTQIVPSKLALTFFSRGGLDLSPIARIDRAHSDRAPSDIQMILPSLLLLLQEGGLVDPRMRASNEALQRARVPRAGGRPGHPLFMFPSFPIAHRIHARRPCNGCNPIRL
jgi:hypothetical protein